MPRDESDRRLVERVLSNPDLFPDEFKRWLGRQTERDPNVSLSGYQVRGIKDGSIDPAARIAYSKFAHSIVNYGLVGGTLSVDRATLGSEPDFVGLAGNGTTYTLPKVDLNPGRVLVIRNVNSNTNTLNPFSGDDIEGATSYPFTTNGETLTLLSSAEKQGDGSTTWYVLNRTQGSAFQEFDIQFWDGDNAAGGTFTTNWTKPAGAYLCMVVCTGSGGGGGSGAAENNTAFNLSGGGGGGGGARIVEWFQAAELGATEAISIAKAGIAGAAVNPLSGGNNGGAGGLAAFGNRVAAGGGGGGAGGSRPGAAVAATSNGGGGGGDLGSGVTGGAGGGYGAGGVRTNGIATGGGGGGSNGVAGGRNGGGSQHGGGGGAGTGITGIEDGGGAGGCSNHGAAGGGAGGSFNAGAGGAPGAGGASNQIGAGGGGAAGTSGPSPTQGADGAAGDSTTKGGNGGGGGGMGNTGVASKKGGAGGSPGGGGGGGGASYQAASGAGGEGGRGQVWVLTLLN